MKVAASFGSIRTSSCLAKKGTGVSVGTGVAVGNGAGLTHPIANAKASKAITLLNRVAIAGYYTHAVTIQHAREGNQD
jgi:hypothetical protein